MSPPGAYLVFVGRIGSATRLDRAIARAHAVDRRLVIAGSVAPADQAYFDHALGPVIRDTPFVEDHSESAEWEKAALLGGAYAMVCPAVQDASSGLAVLEAMATGAPVAAYGAGVASEAAVGGVTGVMWATLPARERVVERVAGLERRACRARVENRFSPAVRATAYEHQYAALLVDAHPPRRGGAALTRLTQRARGPSWEVGATESWLGRRDDGLPIALPLRLDAGVPIPHAERPPAVAERPVPAPRRDPVDIASEDSFPASDPPGWIGSGGEPAASVAGARALNSSCGACPSR